MRRLLWRGASAYLLKCFFIQRSPVRIEQSCMSWHMFGLPGPGLRVVPRRCRLVTFAAMSPNSLAADLDDGSVVDRSCLRLGHAAVVASIHGFAARMFQVGSILASARGPVT